jgi:hypothetical protein
MGGYILVIVAAVVLVPVLFALFGRRPAGGRRPAQLDHGVTPAQPSSDQPTPRSGRVNEIAPDVTKRIPPG